MNKRLETLYHKIDSSFVEEVVTKLRNNQKVHRRIKGRGLLHIDRQLPFLTLFRSRGGDSCQYTARLIKGEAAYFVIPASLPKARVSVLVRRIVQELSQIFGGFLLLEVWVDNTLDDKYQESDPLAPIMEVYADTSGDLISTCERLREALVKLKIQRKQAKGGINYHHVTRPKGLSPILTKKFLLDLKCYSIGIGVKPVYMDRANGECYPLIFKKFHAGFSHALKHAFFEFSNTMARHTPTHYHSLGAKAVTSVTYRVDHQLAKLSAQLDFLLWVTPVNTEDSWKRFKKDKFERVPRLKYRPVPIDPAKLKQDLFSIEMRKVHDPTIQELFEQKRIELDRQLTMIFERNTKNFVLSSMQLYGRVEDNLYALADEILHKISGRIVDDTFTGKHDAQDFASLAQQEIELLCTPKIKKMPKVVLTDEVSGLMVNKGDLYVGKSVRIPNNRAQALLQHEVGTHVVSFINGSYQPLKLFSYGLPGYDELQEGLAVLAEFLVGQLSNSRLKLLAARVVAAKYLEDGARLKDIFILLTQTYQFEPKTAYRIAVRIVRGGGLTKDAIYLRGLNQVVKYLQADGDFEILFAGKFSQTQVPIVQELMYRGILKKPKILPSYLSEKKALKRLENVKQSVSLLDLIEKKAK